MLPIRRVLPSPPGKSSFESVAAVEHFSAAVTAEPKQPSPNPVGSSCTVSVAVQMGVLDSAAPLTAILWYLPVSELQLEPKRPVPSMLQPAAAPLSLALVDTVVALRFPTSAVPDLVRTAKYFVLAESLIPADAVKATLPVAMLVGFVRVASLASGAPVDVADHSSATTFPICCVLKALDAATFHSMLSRA